MREKRFSVEQMIGVLKQAQVDTDVTQIQLRHGNGEGEGAHCDYREMASNHGHDAFLAEPDQLVRLLTPVFE